MESVKRITPHCLPALNIFFTTFVRNVWSRNVEKRFTNKKWYSLSHNSGWFKKKKKKKKTWRDNRWNGYVYRIEITFSDALVHRRDNHERKVGERDQVLIKTAIFRPYAADNSQAFIVFINVVQPPLISSLSLSLFLISFFSNWRFRKILHRWTISLFLHSVFILSFRLIIFSKD